MRRALPDGYGNGSAIISETLDALGETLGCSVEALMMAIDDRVNLFFELSLQLDVFTMGLEFK